MHSGLTDSAFAPVFPLFLWFWLWFWLLKKNPSLASQFSLLFQMLVKLDLRKARETPRFMSADLASVSLTCITPQTRLSARRTH